MQKQAKMMCLLIQTVGGYKSAARQPPALAVFRFCNDLNMLHQCKEAKPF